MEIEAVYYPEQGAFSKLYADTLFLYYIIIAGAEPSKDTREQ